MFLFDLQVVDPVLQARMLSNATAGSRTFQKVDFTIASLVMDQVVNSEEIRSNTGVC